jgi:hypothetical protein
MSQSGALIDGAALPAAGVRVRLIRGALTVVGSVAWAANGQAGLRFDAELDVRSWTGRPGHSGQQRVDGIISAVRRGRFEGEIALNDPQPESLALLSAALDQLCERLANDPALSVTHGEELVRLDFIAQSLRRHAETPR